MAVTISGSGPVSGVTTLSMGGALTGATSVASPSTINGLTLPTDSLQPGMVLLTSPAFSASATVSINNCFSSTYTNYLIVTVVSSSADGANMYWRFRSSGSDISTGSYYWRRILNVAETAAVADTAYLMGQAGNSANNGILNTTFSRTGPYPVYTSFAAYQSAANYVGHTGLAYNGAGADGFSIFASSGNITGTVRVYGYRNA